MVPEDDARTTVELDDRYVIQPTFPWCRLDAVLPRASACPDAVPLRVRHQRPLAHAGRARGDGRRRLARRQDLAERPTGRLLPYGRQLVDDDDIAAVTRVLRSDYLTTGPEVEAFESELADACGARHAVAVANGTAALHCAYAAPALRPGTRSSPRPLTFSATANMVLAMGGRPVFADIDRDTLCLDPATARGAPSARRRAPSLPSTSRDTRRT